MRIKINYIEDKEELVFRKFDNLLVTEEALDFIRRA